MSETLSSEGDILAACARALRLAPESYPPTLPSLPGLRGAPAWYPFEHAVWPIGEAIRQAFSRVPRLKRSGGVVSKVLEVATCPNLRRGRQSFIMALGFVGARDHAASLVRFVDDPDVDGQVVDTLLKMKAPGFANRVQPLTFAKEAWVRRLAQRYVARYPGEV